MVLQVPEGSRVEGRLFWGALQQISEFEACPSPVDLEGGGQKAGPFTNQG